MHTTITYLFDPLCGWTRSMPAGSANAAAF